MDVSSIENQAILAKNTFRLMQMNSFGLLLAAQLAVQLAAKLLVQLAAQLGDSVLEQPLLCTT